MVSVLLAPDDQREGGNEQRVVSTQAGVTGSWRRRVCTPQQGQGRLVAIACSVACAALTQQHGAQELEH